MEQIHRERNSLTVVMWISGTTFVRLNPVCDSDGEAQKTPSMAGVIIVNWFINCASLTGLSAISVLKLSRVKKNIIQIWQEDVWRIASCLGRANCKLSKMATHSHWGIMCMKRSGASTPDRTITFPN